MWSVLLGALFGFVTGCIVTMLSLKGLLGFLTAAHYEVEVRDGKAEG